MLTYVCLTYMHTNQKKNTERKLCFLFNYEKIILIIHKIHIKQVRMVTQRDKMHGKREWEKEKQK